MINIEDYDFGLPENLIAKEPATPRDSSKLFVYDTQTDKIIFDRFYNLLKHIPKDSLLVLNNTKVVPSRVEVKKETGGKLILLFLVNEINEDGKIRALADRKIDIGDKVFLSGQELKVCDREEHIFSFNYKFSREELLAILQKEGSMPIPLYLKDTHLNKKELSRKYQTIFAKYEGSSAAPTASLHFTKRVFNKLKKDNIDSSFITLHVGLGTFAPITEDNLLTKKLHSEWYEISASTILKIRSNLSKKNKVIAVGTTVTRTLESYMTKGETKGTTELFIQPPYDFKIIKGLITNFHIPKSSLMMLVDSFLEYKKSKKRILELYKIAVHEKFRFYSFGDAMLIL